MFAFIIDWRVVSNKITCFFQQAMPKSSHQGALLSKQQQQQLLLSPRLPPPSSNRLHHSNRPSKWNRVTPTPSGKWFPPAFSKLSSNRLSKFHSRSGH